MFKTKKTIVFQAQENGNLDYTDKRLARFMTIPLKYESLMAFGVFNKNRYKMVFGIGMVKKIEHTEKNYDIVWMNFGNYDRPVIVWEYNARKQMITLSRNKFAFMYGFLKLLKNKQGKPVPTLYARALQGMYVPTAFDVKKKYSNFEFDQEDDNSENFQEFMDDIMEIKDNE